MHKSEKALVTLSHLRSITFEIMVNQVGQIYVVIGFLAFNHTQAL